MLYGQDMWEVQWNLGKIWPTMPLFFDMSRSETEKTVSELTDNDEQHNVHERKRSVQQ